jgi:hypothetical protein
LAPEFDSPIPNETSKNGLMDFRLAAIFVVIIAVDFLSLLSTKPFAVVIKEGKFQRWVAAVGFAIRQSNMEPENQHPPRPRRETAKEIGHEHERLKPPRWHRRLRLREFIIHKPAKILLEFILF